MAGVEHGTSFGHDAILHASEDQFLSAAVPFVQEGVDTGEVVLVNVDPVSKELLRAELPDDPLVRIGDQSVYTQPTSTLMEFQRQFTQERINGAAGVRAFGIVALGRQEEWRGWMRFEGLVNHVFSGLPFRALCPYDVTVLAPEVVEGVRRSHRGLHDGADYTPDNPEYVGPADFLGLTEYAPRANPLEAQRPALDVPDLVDLYALRLDVNLATVGTDLHRRAATDFGYAVSEIARNALNHGEPPVRVRVWISATEAHCAISDRGPGNPDPLSGYRRVYAGGSGREKLGLWAARQLCDVLDYGFDAEGFTVRLSVSRRQSAD